VSPVDWLPRNAGQLWQATVDHVILTLIALVCGLAISLVLAMVVRADRRWNAPLTAVTGALYTIPSLALFAVLVPLTGLSVVTAEIGLISYTLLILLRSLVSGLDAVPPDVLEASDGSGMSSHQRLLRVELPLAMPYLIAGLRVATVTTIGLVMVTALIGEGGLGQVMLRGFNLRNWTAVYAGAVLTVGLAVVADVGLVIVGKRLTPWVGRQASRA